MAFEEAPAPVIQPVAAQSAPVAPFDSFKCSTHDVEVIRDNPLNHEQPSQASTGGQMGYYTAVNNNGENEVVRGLKRRVEELENENAKLKSDLAKARWPISSAGRSSTPSSSAAAFASSSSSSAPAAKKQKTPAQAKKCFEKWAKALERQVPREKFGSCGMDEKKVVVKEGTAMAKDEFDSLFSKKGGTLIQPTKDNKPTSVITIIRFPDYAAIKAIFGEAAIPESGYKASIWRSRAFQKSYKAGTANAKIVRLDAVYNKSKMTLEMHFWLDAEGGIDECSIM